MNLKIGDKAPEFELPDQNAKKHNLADYLGKWVLLYFYPQDDTSGCTKEACSLRDAFPSFGNINAEVLGVSIDSVASHKQFAEKYNLPFTLLADESKAVSELYGVLNEAGKDKRTSFLINSEGKIAKVYEDVNPENHSKEVLDDLQLLINSNE